jgi:hypothetical protein
MHRWAVITKAVGVCAAAACACEAGAGYTGLSVDLAFDDIVVNGAHRDVWRVYAEFTDANDYLTGASGGPVNGAMVIQTVGGALFFNPGGPASNGPPAPGTPEYYGTYATVGVSDLTQGDPFDFPFAGPMFIQGNQYNQPNGGWFTAGPVEFGRAGWTGDGDLSLRVLCMQLAVDNGEHVQGTVNIAGVNNAGLAGGTSFVAAQQTFTSVPGAGAAALLAGAVLMRGRRRR